MLWNQEFGTVLELVFGNAWVVAILGLLAADVISGIAKSMYDGDFRLGETAGFLWTRAIPFVMGAGSLQIILLTVPDEYRGVVTSGMGTAVWVAAIAGLLAQVLDNLRQMGLPIPAILTAKDKPETKVVL
jgi:hypothetical protein